MYYANPDFNLFKKNYLKRKNQLFWKVFKSDLDTPVSAYLKLCQNTNKKLFSFRVSTRRIFER